MATCEECGKYVKDDNLLRHYQTTHPKASVQGIPRPPRKKVPVSGKTKKIAGIILAVTVLAGLVITFPSPIGLYPYPDCINHSGLAYHWHATLQITSGGQPYAVPANIGITSVCMSPTHTHDSSGTVHIESPDASKRYTLGDFFEVWSKNFGSPQMTVDGRSSSQGAALMLTDGLTIQLAYESFA